MQVRALKTFNGRIGLVRTGEVITVDDRYGKQLVSNKLAAPHKPGDKAPESNKDLGDAPSNKDANDEGDGGGNGTESSQDEDDGEKDDSKGEQQAGGKGRAVSSRQVGRRSRKKT